MTRQRALRESKRIRLQTAMRNVVARARCSVPARNLAPLVGRAPQPPLALTNTRA